MSVTNSQYWDNTIAQMDKDEKLNEFGNEVYRMFILRDSGIFYFQACTASDGWMNIETHQDGTYFGVWHNEDQLRIVTFCEGDVTVEQAKTKDAFYDAIESTVSYYKRLAS